MSYPFGNSSPFGSNNNGSPAGFGNRRPHLFTNVGSHGATFNPSNTTPALNFGADFGTPPAATTAVSTFENIAPHGLSASELPPSKTEYIEANPSLKEPLFYSQSDTNSKKLHQVYTSVYATNIFNDERDHILKKWNSLQACWGFGKGYFNVMIPPIEYTPETPLYLFRTIGYNKLLYYDNSDGIVLLIFDRPYEELKNQQEAIRNGIIGILGNNPYFIVDVIEINSFNDTQTKVKIVMYEKSGVESSRKIPAFETSAFLNQPLQKQQLSYIGTVLIVPVDTSSNRIEIDEYLRKVPPGIEVQKWREAITNNPNPSCFIPVLMNGFADLHTKMCHSQNQLALQQALITTIKEDIRKLRQKNNEITANLMLAWHEYKQRSHRILKIIAKQERARRLRRSMSPLEEVVQHRLYSLRHLKPSWGEIQNFLFNIRTEKFKEIQENIVASHDIIPQEVLNEIAKFIDNQHKDLKLMVKVLKWDIRTMKVMYDDMDAHGLIPKENFKRVEERVLPNEEVIPRPFPLHQELKFPISLHFMQCDECNWTDDKHRKRIRSINTKNLPPKKKKTISFKIK